MRVVVKPLMRCVWWLRTTPSRKEAGPTAKPVATRTLIGQGTTRAGAVDKYCGRTASRETMSE